MVIPRIYKSQTLRATYLGLGKAVGVPLLSGLAVSDVILTVLDAHQDEMTLQIHNKQYNVDRMKMCL